MRSALVDYFRDDGRIMIATEAGAEGINLQFCSLVVNYDLPWNPQRIEQRIGRELVSIGRCFPRINHVERWFAELAATRSGCTYLFQGRSTAGPQRVSA
jgi:hypothetical protein